MGGRGNLVPWVLPMLGETGSVQMKIWEGAPELDVARQGLRLESIVWM